MGPRLGVRGKWSFALYQGMRKGLKGSVPETLTDERFLNHILKSVAESKATLLSG